MPKKSKGTIEEAMANARSASFLSDPVAAANQIDAILFFIHKRYATKPNSGSIPSLNSFMIYRADVVFTDEVKHVVLDKKPAKNTLQILSPPVPKEKEEERRIYLLKEFGPIIIRCQSEAFQQIRETLLTSLDADGKEILVNEFLEFKEKEKNVQGQAKGNG